MNQETVRLPRIGRSDMPTIGFAQWLRTQTTRSDAIGDLARDPRYLHHTLRSLRFLLALKGTPAQRATLERAITEWRRL